MDSSMFKKLHDKSGVTLVELLVVILIVTILSVSLIPFFRKYVNQAQYAAEAKPLIGHLRTQIDLYMYGNGGALPFDELGVVSFKEKTPGVWEPYVTTLADETSSTIANVSPTGTAATWSPLRKMDVAIKEMQGNHMNPGQLQFVCTCNTNSAYAYAIGIFGRDGGLAVGTGYAVYEASFPKVKSGEVAGQEETGFKLIGTYEKMSAEGLAKGFGTENSTVVEAVKVSGLDSLTLTTPTDVTSVKTAVQEMLADWTFNGI